MAYPGTLQILGVPLLSEERIKLRALNFVGTFRGSIRTKARENVGNSSRGRSQGVPKIFRAPMYRAHCAVIFAIAQLSCENILFIPKFEMGHPERGQFLRQGLVRTGNFGNFSTKKPPYLGNGAR